MAEKGRQARARRSAGRGPSRPAARRSRRKPPPQPSAIRERADSASDSEAADLRAQGRESRPRRRSAPRSKPKKPRAWPSRAATRPRAPPPKPKRRRDSAADAGSGSKTSGSALEAARRLPRAAEAAVGRPKTPRLAKRAAELEGPPEPPSSAPSKREGLRKREEKRPARCRRGPRSRRRAARSAAERARESFEPQVRRSSPPAPRSPSPSAASEAVAAAEKAEHAAQAATTTAPSSAACAARQSASPPAPRGGGSPRRQEEKLVRNAARRPSAAPSFAELAEAAEARMRRTARPRKRASAPGQERAAARAALARAEQERAEASAANQQPRRRVRDVDLIQDRDADRVVIALSSPAKPVVIKNRGNEAVLEIPERRHRSSNDERTLDTSKLPGPVKARCRRYRDPRATRRRPGGRRPRSPNPGRAQAGRHHLLLGLPAAGDVIARSPPTIPRRRPATAPVHSDYPTAAVAGYGASSAPITQRSVSQLSRRKKTYSGKKIDLDYKDADIHNLLRLLADVGNVNIVVPDDIHAKVTIRLRRVPWDQALDVILASKGLGYKLEGPGLYRIASQEELQKEFERKLAQAKARAEAEAPEAEVFNLNYVKAEQRPRPARATALAPRAASRSSRARTRSSSTTWPPTAAASSTSSPASTPRPRRS